MMKTLKQHRWKPQKNSEEHILPLINVVFLLLIFFMIAGRLTTSDPFKIALSKSLSSTQIDQEAGIIHLGIEGRVAFQNKEISKDELSTLVHAHLKDNPDVVLRLKVDGTHNAGDVLSLMTGLRKAGVEKISLITQLEPHQ